jgi:hypothetical protein
MRWKMIVGALCALTAGEAAGHGPQIQITGETGRIMTRRLIQDGPYSESLTAATSVYVMPLREFVGVWYSRPNEALVLGQPEFFSGPGFAYGYGYDPLTPGSAPFTEGAKFQLGFTAGLKRWDGAAFVDAGPAAMESFLGGNPNAPTGVARTSDAGPFASLAIPAGAGTISFTSDGDETHNTVRHRLLGDGSLPASASQDGVYLVSLQLSITSNDKTPSDSFYFVLHKNAAGEADAAAASLGFAPELVQRVPEPSAACLTALAILAGLGRMRQRRFGS